MATVESYDVRSVDRGEVLRYLGYAGQPITPELDARIDEVVAETTDLLLNLGEDLMNDGADIDVDSLIGTYMAGHARAATSLLPDYFRHYHRAATVYSYDPEKARKLLAEAGVDELALTLRANDNWVSTLAPAIAEDWKAVGVTAEVVLLDTTALFADLSTEPEPGTLLPFDVVLSPGDPSCFGNDADLIISWWYGDNVWTRARSRWATTPAFAEMAELLAEARSKTSEDEQQPLWNQCFDIIAAEVPLYPLFHRETATAWWTAQLDDYDPISATGLNFLGTTPMRDADPI